MAAVSPSATHMARRTGPATRESDTRGCVDGLPFYVGAITYIARIPTTFYTRKRTDVDLRVLTGARSATRSPVPLPASSRFGGGEDELQGEYAAQRGPVGEVGPAARCNQGVQPSWVVERSGPHGGGREPSARA